MLNNLGKRNIVIVLGLLVLILVSIGASRKKQAEPGLELDVSEDELDVLGDSIEGLEFDDLGGISDGDADGLGFSEDDLNILGDALNDLVFEDLEGLSDN